MTDPSGTTDNRARARMHLLQLDEIDLVGGSRVVEFRPGFNVIRGDITTGKTTLVRLLRALVGTVPSQLPPEVALVRFLRGRITLGTSQWGVLRPLTTTRDAVVEVARRRPGTENFDETLRLPASGSDGSYSRFLLDRLGLPAVSVPKARQDPTAAMTPVSATDWLGYCSVTGDELDAQIFGHHNTWRDQKRRWVFELTYGLYDIETAQLNAELRGLEMRLRAMMQEHEILAKFLADTPFSDGDQLRGALTERTAQLAAARAQQVELATVLTKEAQVKDLRAQVVDTATTRDRLREEHRNLSRQITDLRDLRKQLQSQSARLTQAIVADEWLVDFKFLVCPRCGSEVADGRAPAGLLPLPPA